MKKRGIDWDEAWPVDGSEMSDEVRAHNADLWAMSYGFCDVEQMRAEAARMEREWQLENANKGSD